MADPYAERSGGPEPERPASDDELAALVRARGGRPVADCAGLAAAGEGTRVVLLLAGQGLFPPIARLTAEQAALLLAPACDDGADLEAALEAARRAETLLAVKRGLVGGPAGAAGALEVDPVMIESVLEANAAGEITWERDPDFGYEVAASCPRLDPDAERALCPRLLYADHDRVYEHADLVAETKREWHSRISSFGRPPVAAVAASGWPIEPTGQSWKD